MASRVRRPKAPYIVRIVRARPRLFISALFGLVVLIALEPTHWERSTQLLVSWDSAMVLYLGAVLHLMAQADVAKIRERAAIEDEGQTGILVLTVAAALASLGAIIAELAGTAAEPSRLALAVVTVLLSWTFIHMMFSLHYAHEYYSPNDGKGGGLAFPGDEEPDYWDFVYFSFVIGMTSQVSDVGISCKPIRRTATAHGVVSFVFNAALLALTVNIAASMVQSSPPPASPSTPT